MGAVKWTLIVCGVAALLSYGMYQPVPSGYSLRSTAVIYSMVFSMRILEYVVAVKEVLGCEYSVNNTRNVLAFASQMRRAEPTPGVEVRDEIFDGVMVRVYSPVVKRDESKRAGFVFYHGGGWCTGTIDFYQDFVSKLSNDSGIVFVSVEYRLAPEFPFPAAFDDSLTAAKYFLVNAEKFGVDPQRVAVGGDSAGGNLAAAVSLRLRDESFSPLLRLVALFYPSVQMIDFTLPSMLSNSHGPILTLKQTARYKGMYMTGYSNKTQEFQTNSILPAQVYTELRENYLNITKLPSRFIDHYAPPGVERMGDVGLSGTELDEIRARMLSPYASPLLAPSLAGLPHTYILTCEHDVLRDEGFLYSRRLQEEGVTVTHHNIPHGFHGLISLYSTLPEAHLVLNDVIKYLVLHL